MFVFWNTVVLFSLLAFFSQIIIVSIEIIVYFPDVSDAYVGAAAPEQHRTSEV